MARIVTIPSLLPAANFYLAAGTVTVDPRQRMVLIIRDRAAGIYQLPRGRKDWGESLEATAERETLEETGARCRLLPVPLATRATCPVEAATDPTHPWHGAAQSARFVADGDVLAPGSARVIEPLAVMQHRQPNGALAMVLWYAAVGDSTAPLATGTQMADEDYQALWVGYEAAAALMVNADYDEVVQRAVALVSAAMGREDGVQRDSGRLTYDDWAAGPCYGTENFVSV